MNILFTKQTDRTENGRQQMTDGPSIPSSRYVPPSLTPEEWEEYRRVENRWRDKFDNWVQPDFPYEWGKAIQIRDNKDL
ncbi:hypothetical protein ACFV14_29125 [Streptomyces zaomyceticus]|uniref:hypothetical protein n=1 Tax=Streptomyces zaomyceticus TaxID=68286 RepID=UPI00368A1C54